MALFDIKNRDNLRLYYQFKEKNGYAFTAAQRLDFKNRMVEILSFEIKTESIVVPESTNQLFLEIIQSLGKKIYVLQKRSKAQVLEFLSAQSMMKAERAKLLKSIEDNPLKMAFIAGNQRARVAQCWFEPLELTEAVTLIDDSVFSGYTLEAAKNALKAPIDKTIIMFSKQD